MDAYFDVAVRQAHRKILHFAFMGVAYEYQCLPFGYSLTLCTFSKCVETVLGQPTYSEQLRRICEKGHHDGENHLSFLGFAINFEKSSPLPSRQIVYSGLCLDSTSTRRFPVGTLLLSRSQKRERTVHHAPAQPPCIPWFP